MSSRRFAEACSHNGTPVHASNGAAHMWQPAPVHAKPRFSELAQKWHVSDLAVDMLVAVPAPVVRARQQCARALVQRGADTTAFNRLASSPIDMADEHGLVALSNTLHFAGTRSAVSRAVLTRVVKDKGQCSFAVAQSSEVEQEMWGCRTCDIGIDRGFCTACRNSCHRVRVVVAAHMAAGSSLCSAAVCAWFGCVCRATTSMRCRCCGMECVGVVLATTTTTPVPCWSPSHPRNGWKLSPIHLVHICWRCSPQRIV